MGGELGDEVKTHPLNTMTLKKDEYFTPLWVWSAVRKFDPGPPQNSEIFDLDPCTSPGRPWDIAKSNMVGGGLENHWFGRVWMNPPYDRKTGLWMKKLADHGRGTALIFARTDTQFFQEQVFARATGVLFLRGRIHFCGINGKAYEHNSGAPSCLVAYGLQDWGILRNCELKGFRMKL